MIGRYLEALVDIIATALKLIPQHFVKFDLKCPFLNLLYRIFTSPGLQQSVERSIRYSMIRQK